MCGHIHPDSRYQYVVKQTHMHQIKRLKAGYTREAIQLLAGLQIDGGAFRSLVQCNGNYVAISYMLSLSTHTHDDVDTYFKRKARSEKLQSSHYFRHDNDGMHRTWIGGIVVRISYSDVC